MPVSKAIWSLYVLISSAVLLCFPDVLGEDFFFAVVLPAEFFLAGVFFRLFPALLPVDFFAVTTIHLTPVSCQKIK
jgi:hypothetical protein